MDWSACPDVERSPDRMSGAWVVQGTRVPAASIVENAAAGYTAEEIAADIFPSAPVELVKRIISLTSQHETNPA